MVVEEEEEEEEEVGVRKKERMVKGWTSIKPLWVLFDERNEGGPLPFDDKRNARTRIKRVLRLRKGKIVKKS
jgi:hypothetical protein